MVVVTRGEGGTMRDNVRLLLLARLVHEEEAELMLLGLMPIFSGHSSVGWAAHTNVGDDPIVIPALLLAMIGRLVVDAATTTSGSRELLLTKAGLLLLHRMVWLRLIGGLVVIVEVVVAVAVAVAAALAVAGPSREQLRTLLLGKGNNSCWRGEGITRGVR